MTRIGIMGGTFDPIHTGHLILAEAARDQLALDRVIFVPAARSPFKREQRMASAADRWAMVELATAGNPHFSASRIELDREGLSYTVDTLRALKQETAADLYFITGADAIIGFSQWRSPREILALATLATHARPGTGARRLKATLAKLHEEFGVSVAMIGGPKIDLSSTDIRDRARSGRSLRYLVPDPVADYIVRHRLYSQ
ncbi:MAG: nicotinate-nucleotide adenylyltransferase [Chloroflexota bacterium]